MNEKEIYEICQSVDAFIAEYLTESIVIGTSYDMLEAHHGILLTSRTQFYRKKQKVKNILEKKYGQIVEEQNGQLRMVW